MSDNSGGGEFFAGLLIGGLVGAAAALLLAPQSGEETRTQIRDASFELKERANETIAEAREKADAITADARRRAEEIVAEARKRSEETQQAGLVPPQPGHCQSRISGMSSPCSTIYCLCSVRLSRMSCFTWAARWPSAGTRSMTSLTR